MDGKEWDRMVVLFEGGDVEDEIGEWRDGVGMDFVEDFVSWKCG